MASLASKFCRQGLLKAPNISASRHVLMSSYRNLSKGKQLLIGAVGVAAAGGVGIITALNQSVKALDLILHPPSFPWYHKGFIRSLEHDSIRRGYYVYKNVCAACHSMKYLCYRNLVGVSHTEDEAKAEAEESQVEDGPDDSGAMFMRPGKLSDRFPNPYPNDEAARAANNGALPPDLSYIILGREAHEDYVFSLLTGYCDAPAGFHLDEGQHYNPYFPGGAISMAQSLYNEVFEYDDGTPPTASQFAKDVCVFLKWAGEPEWDTRMNLAVKVLILIPALIGATYYYKKLKFSTFKTMKLVYKPKYQSPPQDEAATHIPGLRPLQKKSGSITKK